MRHARNRENRVAVCTALLWLVIAPAGLAHGDLAADSARSAAPAPAMLYAPFQHAPLDGPLLQTGSFGEYRPGRFHAGLDLSTGEVVGQPVYAPLESWVERVRVSGVGYGRSIVLHSADGRLVLLGHLDAYDEPIGSYVAAAQDSFGQYEQDLWPERTRFPVHAGQRLGWSGRSGGVGQPHLHVEIRRGDMALNPLLAGASVVDSSAPVITAVTLEVRTADSRINGRSAPLRLVPGSGADTVRIQGSVRAEVEARDSGVRRADMQPYQIELRWGEHFLRCAFDSLSWATDMPEGPLIYDVGRIAEERRHAVLMWAPAGFRPRAISSDAPLAEEAGRLERGRDGGAVRLDVSARDLSGHSAAASWVLLFSPANDSAPPSAPCRDVIGRLANFAWHIPAAACFGAGTGFDSLRAESLGIAAPAGDLAPVGRRLLIEPRWLPLRQPIDITVHVPAGLVSRRLGLCVRGTGDWEWLTSTTDSSATVWSAHPTHLGEFSFFEDRLAPRVTALAPPRHRGSVTPYSRWALEAHLTEEGSGVNARASGFVVDGRKRPTEWDAVDRKLRWKPRTPPASGTHRYVVIAADRAGNERRVTGTFVIN